MLIIVSMSFLFVKKFDVYMFADTVFVCLCLMIANGVFGVDADEVKSVSVMEGDSVTLHTDLTHIQRDDLILWTFGPQETRIAEIHGFDIIYGDEFETRFWVNRYTGSLTISNITITNSELYQLKIRSYRGDSDKIFRVAVNTVYDHLPDPVITSYCSQDPPLSLSSFNSKCVLLCSVMNVTHVSLSWYKGNSLLSSISVSDLNIRLSLPLEVEYHDTNTYRCVINNPITKHTQQLDINDVCQPCSKLRYILLIAAGSVGLLLIVLVITCVCCCFYKKKSNQANRSEQRDSPLILPTTTRRSL
ncbi:natural killer cell receptor 2B4-like [Triplophysa dalaica]|uniref:natural killer cell receptor 2B4-like n=1 Tax=Triplophysa dalaica TaxID=1582913 RepID=UPI0024DFF79E|nr:natural killer cell receptor 2B4-like [Triplophysa dalaica]